ncbi:MAG: tetratricopeptide repeat protein, partial [Pseudomonadota bacterium]
MAEAEELLALIEERLGPDALELLDTLMMIAEMQAALDPRANHVIVPILERMVTIAEGRVPPSHPGILMVKAELGFRLLLDAPRRSLALMREAWQVGTEALGPSHPVVTQAATRYGSAAFSNGDLVEAEAALRAAVTGMSAAPPPHPPLIALAQRELAYVLVATGAVAEAEPYARAALAGTRKLPPGAEREVARAEFALAFALLAQKRLAQETDALIASALAPHRPTQQMLASDMLSALAMQSIGTRGSLSQTFIARALEVARGFEQRDPQVELHLIMSLIHRGGDDIATLTEAEARALSLLGPAAPQTLEIATLIAVAHSKSNNLAAAREGLNTVMALASASGALYEEMDAARLLTSVEIAAGHIDRAIDLGQRATALAQRFEGRVGLQTLLAMNPLIIALIADGDLETAERLTEEGLTAATDMFGINHPQTVEFLILHAQVLGQVGRHAEALALTRRALIANEASLGGISRSEEVLLPVRMQEQMLLLATELGAPNSLAQSTALARDARRLLGPDDILTIGAETVTLMHRAMQDNEADGRRFAADAGALIARLDRAVPEPTVIHTQLRYLQAYALIETDPQSALALYDEAFEMSQGAGVSGADVDASLQTMAIMLDATGEFSAADIFFARALDAFAQAPAATQNPQFAQFALTAAHWMLAQPEAAGRPNTDITPLQLVQWPLERAAGQALRSAAERFSASDPDLAALLRRQQDLQAELGELDAARLSAFDAGDTAGAIDLQAQMRAMRTDLAGIATDISEAAPDFALIGGAAPMSAQEVAALLIPGEALLFLSPTQEAPDGRIAPGVAILVRANGDVIAEPLTPNLIHSSGIDVLRCNIAPDTP